MGGGSGSGLCREAKAPLPIGHLWGEGVAVVSVGRLKLHCLLATYGGGLCREAKAPLPIGHLWGEGVAVVSVGRLKLHCLLATCGGREWQWSL